VEPALALARQRVALNALLDKRRVELVRTVAREWASSFCFLVFQKLHPHVLTPRISFRQEKTT
jgi:hypothetical protein